MKKWLLVILILLAVLGAGAWYFTRGSTEEAKLARDLFTPTYTATEIGKSSHYKAKDFSYLTKQLEGISPSLIEMHITLYKGYVNNTNKLLDSIRQMVNSKEERTIAYGALKRRFGWEMDGMLLHEAYFSNLVSKGPLSEKSALYKQIERDFGSFGAWANDYMATGMIRGIGWVILYLDPKDGHLHNVWINEHDVGHIAGGTPILVMDVWEHAYITQFGLKRDNYIKTFFKNINWEVAEKRFDEAKS